MLFFNTVTELSGLPQKTEKGDKTGYFMEMGGVWESY